MKVVIDIPSDRYSRLQYEMLGDPSRLVSDYEMYIANGVPYDLEIEFQKVCQEEKAKEKSISADGIITVEEFEKAVAVFGFESPVVTAIWNTMWENRKNSNEFDIIYSNWMEHKYTEVKA